MNRRRLAIGISSVSGLAVVSVGAMSMLSSGSAANAVDLHTTPVAAVTNAGAATDKSGTAQVDTLVTMTTPAGPARGKAGTEPAKTATMHGTGLVDFGKRVGSIDLTLPNGGLQEVLTPASLYLREATAPPTVDTSAKGWSRIDVTKSPDGNLVSGGATDPSMAFAMLAGTQPGVKYVGQDKVRGVPVAHYQGTLDLQQAASAAQKDQKQALANAARAFTTTKIPFDAYLDEQGRLRRFVAVFSFTMPGPAGSGRSAGPVARVTSATELFGFGTPVTVVTPSAAPATSGAGGAPGAPRAGSRGRGATTPSAHLSSPRASHK